MVGADDGPTVGRMLGGTVGLMLGLVVGDAVLGGNDGDVVGDNVPVHGTLTSSAKHDRNCSGREPSLVVNVLLSATVAKLACLSDGHSSGM